MPELTQKQNSDDPRQSGSPHSLYLGSPFGIPLRLHFTFLLLLAYFALMGSGPGRWQTLILMAMLFTCVVLHELGHSVVAQRFGINVSEIVLYPIGGVARLEKLPKPKAEFWIALAGPAVNVVICAILYVFFLPGKLGSTLLNLNQLGYGSWPKLLFQWNSMLIFFNMIPAFPMDGGRVLRAVLAMKMPEYRATQIAATIGQALAFVFAFCGLYFQAYTLLFIAFFVYIGAGQEAAMVQGKALVEGLAVDAAMVTDFQTMECGATLADAKEMLLHTSQTDFPIMVGEEVVGLLSREALLRGLASEGPSGYVAGVMQRDFPATTPDTLLEHVAMQMQVDQISCVLVVVEDGHLLGMVTKENLAELLVVRQIMRRTGRRQS
ncbi:MAG: site-2 protease family protein [Chthonomonadales bacterium]